MIRNITLGILFAVLTSYAAGADTTSVRGPGPILGGHLYQPMTGIAWPFIRTTSNVQLGFGQTLNLQFPIITIGDRVVIAPSGSIVVAAMSASHEQAIKDWLSVYAGIRVVGRLGTNVTSLLAEGVNTVGGGTLGWKVRVLETERFVGTVSLDLTNGSVTTVDVNRFVEGIIDSSAVTSANPLVDSKPSVTAGITARMAYTLSSAFGLVGYVSSVYGEPAVRDSGAASRMFIDGGLSINCDLQHLVSVPLAVTLGAVYRNVPSIEDATQSEHVSTGSLRIGYSGTDHFAIGMQLNAQYTTHDGDRTAFFVGAGLDMRFYY